MVVLAFCNVKVANVNLHYNNRPCGTLANTMTLSVQWCLLLTNCRPPRRSLQSECINYFYSVRKVQFAVLRMQMRLVLTLFIRITYSAFLGASCICLISDPSVINFNCISYQSPMFHIRLNAGVPTELHTDICSIT